MFKKIYVLIYVLSGITFTHALKAQPFCGHQISSVTTPKGSTVQTSQACDYRILTDRKLKDDDCLAEFPGSQLDYRISNPSSNQSYYCHSYAWIYEDYRNDKYILMMFHGYVPTIYLVDGSYIEVTRKIPNAKVYWTSSSHSAIIASDTNRLISKWDTDGPLMNHTWNGSPYPATNSTVKMYLRPAEVPIDGPSSFVGSATYSLPLASGPTIQWSVPSGFSKTGSGNSIVVSATSSTASGNLQATINGVTVSKLISGSMLYLNGPSIICVNTSHNYSTNAPNGYSWNSSSNLTHNNGSGTFTGSSTGTGWISVKDASGNELKKIDVYVVSSSWNPWTITGMPYLYETGGSLEVYNVSPTMNGTWSLTPYNGSVSLFPWISSSSAELTNNYAVFGDVFELKVTFPAVGGCTCASTKSISIRRLSPSPIKIYPNPVSDILYVEIDQNVILSNNNSSIQPNLTFDLRLYDSQAMMQRQTTSKGSSTKQFDVSNLPNGIYYLHFYDGISATPEVHKVIVKH